MIQKLPVQRTRTILVVRDAGEVTESRQMADQILAGWEKVMEVVRIE